MGGSAIGRASAARLEPAVGYTCSEPQKQYWIAEGRHPQSSALHLAASYQICGDLSDSALEDTCNQLVARHATLRMYFDVRSGEPVQVVAPAVAARITFHDLSGLPQSDAKVQAERIAADQARRPFDVSMAPLIRFHRITFSSDSSVVLITAHRLICDERSIQILAEEIAEIGSAVDRGCSVALPELSTAYTRYLEACRDQRASATFGSGAVPSLERDEEFKQVELLPDRPRLGERSGSSALVSREIDGETVRALASIALERSSSIEVVALTAVLTLLHRYTGEADIGIGMQVSSRDSAAEKIIGCFDIILPLRADLSGDPTFTQALERAQRSVTTARGRCSSSGELADVLVKFSFEEALMDDASLNSVMLKRLRELSLGSINDLHLRVVERSFGGWAVSCEYDSELFASTTANAVVDRLALLLSSIVADSSRRISQLSIMTEDERLLLVTSANETLSEYPVEQTVPDLFSAQARRTPNAVALVCGESQQTYGQLEGASNRLARELIRRAILPGDRVGILLERNLDLVVALLAVLKAGGAYVPLDPEYPRERLSYITERSRLAAVISTWDLYASLVKDESAFVLLDIASTTIEANESTPPGLRAAPHDLAYIIYTSGSTGVPKGVQIQHRALANLLHAVWALPGITAADVLVAVTTISFDIAALEIFLPLIAGARLVLATKSETSDGGALLDLLRRQHATVMQATPVTWQVLIESGWMGDPSVKMLCGGEALSRRLADQLLERGSDLWNMYGPTETTIWSSAMRVEAGTGPILLGLPLANTQFYVLDEHRQLAPSGVPGELYIGGDGIARGYFDRPDLTSERFIPDLFRPGQDAVLYRTGDMVRRRSLSTMEFLGRTDQQIKLRGFRIELGEIEAVLGKQAHVLEATAVVRGDTAGEKAIWAFVVPSGDMQQPTPLWLTNLRSTLIVSLPHYMVPSRVVALKALPRTPNGKLDRQALATTIDGPDSSTVELPANATERILATTIAAMLGRENIGRHEDIFDLGFHSVLAVRLVQHISQNFGKQMSLRVLGEARTVASLAQQMLASSGAVSSQEDPKPVFTLNARGSRPSFIYFHNDILAGGMYCRTMALRMPDQKIYALSPHGTAGLGMVPTIEAMALSFLDHIHRIQPEGPYRLGGFCGGGIVAYEVARLLRARGENVERLILINASAPSAQRVVIADLLIRSIGRYARLDATIRESVCYNIACLSRALRSGPASLFRLLVERMNALPAYLTSKGRHESGGIEEFAKRRGSHETELYFAHVIAELTYHPEPCDQDLILLWGTDKTTTPGDPAFGWQDIARSVRVIPILGGHLAPLRDQTEELGTVLRELLA